MLRFFKNLKLYQQLTLLVSASLLFMLFLIVGTTDYFIKDYSRELSNNLKEEIHFAISGLIKNDSDRLSNLAQSHSNWTELIEATERNDRAWINHNATGYMLEDPLYNISELYLSNTDNGYTEWHGLLPQALYLQLYEATHPETLQQQATSYLIHYDNALYLLSISGLTDNSKSILKGFYVLGTRVDQKIYTAIKEVYNSKADVEFNILPLKEPIIVSTTVDSLMTMTQQYFDVHLDNVQLANSVVTKAHLLIRVILAVLIVASLLLLTGLIRLSSNFDKSIQSIKNITYHDYTQTIHLDFSKDFIELSNCINDLSKELSLRDQNINQKVIEIISILVKTLEEVDRYTKGHSERVSHYSVELAKAIQYPDLESIRISGLLHDIGKVTVDINILNKPDRLTDAEFDEIKKHPATAYNILEASDVFLPIRDIVKHHHERVDGTGYPDRLTGDAIPLGAKIVALADVFDSLTSERAYRQPMPIDEALDIIQQGAGTHFDAALTRVFTEIAHDIYASWSGLNSPPEPEELYSQELIES